MQRADFAKRRPWQGGGVMRRPASRGERAQAGVRSPALSATGMTDARWSSGLTRGERGW